MELIIVYGILSKIEQWFIEFGDFDLTECDGDVDDDLSLNDTVYTGRAQCAQAHTLIIIYN